MKLVVCGIGGVFCGFAGCDINIRNFKVRELATWWSINCVSMVMVMVINCISMVIEFQDLIALLLGLLIFGWWLADWVRSDCSSYQRSIHVGLICFDNLPKFSNPLL